ncbi:MAG: hypothetical protein OXE50_01255 [Chloroflexi bacterium]|nr:hypothetical protein [Chloroflexota bacterium]
MNDATSLHQRYLPWMLTLAALFALRVLAQAVQWAGPVPFLPAFDAWQGSGLPYPVLLGSQALIVALLARALMVVRSRSVRPASWKHRACFVLGGAYFGAMAFRLLAGLTFLSEVEWFAGSLPALFHLVLAAFVLLFGHYVYSAGRESGGAA